MPLPFYHIAAAGALAEKYASVRESGDFFLGNIAPDAVLARPGCTLAEKFGTHLRGERAAWGGDVAASFTCSDKSDPFLLGYHMHLIMDIFFRDWWEALFRRQGIPEDEWDALAYRAASRGVGQLLMSGDVLFHDYETWIATARTYRRKTFPFGMTGAQMDAEIEFCANLSPYVGIEMKEETGPVNFSEIYREAVPYLDEIFGAHLRELPGNGGIV